MALEPNIILGGQTLNLGNTLAQIQQLRQQQELQPLRSQLLQQQIGAGEQAAAQAPLRSQLLQQNVQSGEAQQLQSQRSETVIALRAMKPFVDRGDLQGAASVLSQVGVSPEVSQGIIENFSNDPNVAKQNLDSVLNSLTGGPPEPGKLSSVQKKVAAEGIDPSSPKGFARARELNQRSATDPSLKRGANEILNRATGEQLKASGFANRVNAANEGLTVLEVNPDFDPTSITAAALRATPGGNIILSAEQQSFQQFKEDFITAVLRKESGAVISDEEFAREEKKFFPQIGDKKSTLKQKSTGRKRAFENFRKESKGVFDVQFGEQSTADQPATTDFDQSLLEFMTPEERALFNGS